MRNQHNDKIQIDSIAKGEQVLSEIDRLQRNKILGSLCIFVPIMMILTEVATSQHLNAEFVLGYSASILIFVGYFFMREMYLLSMYGAEIEKAEKQMATNRESKVYSPSMAKSLPYFQLRHASR